MQRLNWLPGLWYDTEMDFKIYYIIWNKIWTKLLGSDWAPAVPSLILSILVLLLASLGPFGSGAVFVRSKNIPQFEFVWKKERVYFSLFWDCGKGSALAAKC